MPLTEAVKLICHLLVLVAGCRGGVSVLREATNVSIYPAANFPSPASLSVSSSRSHNLRQSSVMFLDDKWLGGDAVAVGRGNERTGHLFRGGKSEAVQFTQSRCRLSPVADGETPSACLHLICVHVWERDGERGRKPAEESEAGLKLNHFLVAAADIV